MRRGSAGELSDDSNCPLISTIKSETGGIFEAFVSSEEVSFDGGAFSFGDSFMAFLLLLSKISLKSSIVHEEFTHN